MDETTKNIVEDLRESEKLPHVQRKFKVLKLLNVGILIIKGGLRIEKNKDDIESKRKIINILVTNAKLCTLYVHLLTTQSRKLRENALKALNLPTEEFKTNESITHWLEECNKDFDQWQKVYKSNLDSTTVKLIAIWWKWAESIEEEKGRWEKLNLLKATLEKYMDDDITDDAISLHLNLAMENASRQIFRISTPCPSLQCCENKLSIVCANLSPKRTIDIVCDEIDKVKEFTAAQLHLNEKEMAKLIEPKELQLIKFFDKRTTIIENVDESCEKLIYCLNYFRGIP